MREEKIKTDLKEYLIENKPFTKEDVRGFFAARYEQLTDETLRVRINRLKSKGIIINVGRGIYLMNDKKAFEPEISPAQKKISTRVKKTFPFLNYIIWSSTWLNDLATLQLMRNVIVVEVESGSEDAVFRMMQEDFPSRTFLNPKESEWENYMHGSENIIIKTMISESPHENYHGLKIARLEKILVDLYCDKLWKTIFSSELHNVYFEACSDYSINYTTLLSYAARRAKKEEVWNYIKSLNILETSTIKIIEK